MVSADPTHFAWAVLLGALSAVSLPLGSAAGLLLRPRLQVAAVLAAFGAGALIAALTVELVAPTVLGAHAPTVLGAHAPTVSGAHGGGAAADFFTLAAGALAGGLLFVLLDRVLAERGGFLRKISTTIAHFTHGQRERHETMLRDLGAVPLLRALPAEQVGYLVRDAHPQHFEEGDVLFREGDPADALYVVRSGSVSLSRAGEPVREIGARGVFGELPMLTGLRRTVTATARAPVDALVVRRADFERWRAECPAFDRGVRELASERLAELREREARRSEEARRWGEEAIRALRHGAMVPTPAQVRRVADEHEGAALAVWLGMLIDGVPESIVIGSGLLAALSMQAAAGAVELADVVPYTLIAGLFLSNFPEALSSSLGMRSQGWSGARVLTVWIALVVVTAVGSGAGYVLGKVLPHAALIAVEGVAAGAMLTTISSTMIPEAVHLAGSGSRVGLATLFGFFCAVSFKLLE